MTLAAVGAYTALGELLALGNYDFTRGEHMAIFGVGWMLVFVCASTVYPMVARPSYRCLWLVAPSAVLLGIFVWLCKLPSAAHLLH